MALELKKKNPGINIVYFGDTARYPWGNKSASTVIGYADEISRFFIEKGIKNIIIACNTASALAGDYLSKKYPDVRFLDVIEPVIDKLRMELEARDSGSYRIGIIGTRSTISSKVYENKIKAIDIKAKILTQACPLFVPIVEEGFSDHPVAKLISEEYLSEMRGKIDVLVLGCTHYPYLEKTISEVLGKDVKLISSAHEVVKEVNQLELKNGDRENICYFSDLAGISEKTIKELCENGFQIKQERNTF